jgi:hypothetical protein
MIKINENFRHIKTVVRQTFWMEFVTQFRDHFNDLFKLCVADIAEQMINHYKALASIVIIIDGDSEMTQTQNGTLSRDYEDLYSNMAFSDVELEVEGKTLKAHRLILSSNLSRLF